MGTRHNVRYNLRSENNEVPRYCIQVFNMRGRRRRIISKDAYKYKKYKQQRDVYDNVVDTYCTTTKQEMNQQQYNALARVLYK